MQGQELLGFETDSDASKADMEKMEKKKLGGHMVNLSCLRDIQVVILSTICKIYTFLCLQKKF